VTVRHRSQRIPEIYDDPGSGLNWSHDALQRALFYHPLRDETTEDKRVLDRHLALANDAERAKGRGDLVTADRLAERAELWGRQLDDQTRPANILIEDADGGCAQLPPLTLATIAAWLYGTPAALDSDVVAQLLQPSALEQCRDVLKRIVNLDHSTRAMPSSSGKNDDILSAALQLGLERHEGERLVGAQLTPYLHLLCRGYQPTRLRVCERCQLVHHAARARTCKQCRKSPRRLKPKPWHIGVAVGASASGRTAAIFRHNNSVMGSLTHDRRPPKTIYIGLCVCGNRFQSTRANTRHCKDCGSPRARAARARAKRVPALPRPTSDRSVSEASSRATVMPE
jgi:hypothetical protein